MKARVHGYVHGITDIESAKPEALASLKRYIHKFAMSHVDDSGHYLGRLDPVPEGIEVEVDESRVVYESYRHGGLNLQATYVFDYPEVSA